jgi:ferritin-like metal-binding protein YciE
MTIRTLHDLFIAALEDALYTETLVARRLPVMAAAAGNRQLRAVLESTCQENVAHIARLKRVFDAIDEPANPRRSHCAWGIAEEAASASELVDQQIRDAALLAGVQALKAHAISRYRVLVAWAEEMNHAEVAGLLRKTLREEQSLERALGRIATSWIGDSALAA